MRTLTSIAMHHYDLAITLVAGLFSPTVNAAVPNIAELGSATILSDNDLAGLPIVLISSCLQF